MYAPTKNLLDGVRAAFPKQLFPWDEYFPQMAETDWLCGDGDTIAAKSFFIRQAPFGGSYAVLGGITAALLASAICILMIRNSRKVCSIWDTYRSSLIG